MRQILWKHTFASHPSWKHSLCCFPSSSLSCLWKRIVEPRETCRCRRSFFVALKRLLLDPCVHWLLRLTSSYRHNSQHECITPTWRVTSQNTIETPRVVARCRQSLGWFQTNKSKHGSRKRDRTNNQASPLGDAKSWRWKFQTLDFPCLTPEALRWVVLVISVRRYNCWFAYRV